MQSFWVVRHGLHVIRSPCALARPLRHRKWSVVTWSLSRFDLHLPIADRTANSLRYFWVLRFALTKLPVLSRRPPSMMNLLNRASATGCWAIHIPELRIGSHDPDDSASEWPKTNRSPRAAGHGVLYVCRFYALKAHVQAQAQRRIHCPAPWQWLWTGPHLDGKKTIRMNWNKCFWTIRRCHKIYSGKKRNTRTSIVCACMPILLPCMYKTRI